MNKESSEDFFKKKYTSYFIARFACERELETEQRLQYINPRSYGHQRCVFLVLLTLNRRPRGPTLLAFSTTSCHQRVSKTTGGPEGPFCWVWLSLQHLSPTRLISNSSDFLSPPSYIIVQSPTESPTQSLEWHV